MNSTKNLEIEVCLRSWVTLLPFYNFNTRAYEENATGVDFAKIIQQLNISLTFYLEKAIDVQLNINLNIRPTKINGKTFQRYFNMDFLKEKEISSEKGACLLLYTLDKNSQFDSFQNRIIAEGCFKEISIGSNIQAKSYDRHMGKDYSSSIKDILFKGPHTDTKEKVYFLVPPFLHQQKSSMNFKLLKPQSTETKGDRNGVGKECSFVDKINSVSQTCLLTDSVNTTYLFYLCPGEQVNELENKQLNSVWDIINLYNDYIEDKEIIDIECQFRNTCFEKKGTGRHNTRKIYEDLSLNEEEETEQTNNMSFNYSKIFQPKLANALLELNKSIPMDTISMRASEFVTITPLPDKNLIGSWEKLKMKGNLKQSIYSNIQVLLTLSNMFEHENYFAGELLTALDKLILLHGPPGTGKSSLARALFQKFSVKAISSMMEPINLPPILLLELAPDRIYSRYYGESPKKLSMLFSTIEATLKKEMHGGFMFMIIDEIESLATERSILLANNETTDGVRMVNILLTHLDKLRQYKNFFMIGTSNLIESVDRLFKDRANALYELPLPNEETIYSILEQQIIHFLDLGILYQNSGPNSISCTTTTLSRSSLSQYSSRLLYQITAYCSVSIPFCIHEKCTKLTNDHF